MKQNRYVLIAAFGAFFLLASFLIRLTLLLLTDEAGLDAGTITVAFLKGALFDAAVAVYFSLPAALFLWVMPHGWWNRPWSRMLTYAGFFLTLLLLMFSFFAEITFWMEFHTRFNFIAVDYLIYTYEVVNNINQSYPLPWLFAGMVAATGLVLLLFIRLGVFRNAFASHTRWQVRLALSSGLTAAALLITYFLPNSFAEGGKNRYADELGKAGIYSFFAAYRNNELDYTSFYATLPERKAWELVTPPASVAPRVTPPQKPNVVLVTIESFSAEFMSAFGCRRGLTPFLDSLATQSLLFTRLYANGTRTVRGMEALALSVPPTPGNSIVRRPRNEHLGSLGDVFRRQGYHSTFIYGGDGYFDNMNAFFGNNGFDLIDHGTRLTSDHVEGTHQHIPQQAITFESAWGVCDEDIYAAALRDADAQYHAGKPFFQFIMTVSNHRPYTYPDGRVDIPSGTGREGAVKYTDYALGQFIRQMQRRPWFENTVVVIVADHCANSAGRNVINVNRYRIPCLIYHLGAERGTIHAMCSQIDLFPTLFAKLGWNVPFSRYGQDVCSPHYRARAFVGTYQKLGYLQGDTLVVLSPGRQTDMYKVTKGDTELVPLQKDSALIERAIANYQTASLAFKRLQERGGREAHRYQSAYIR
ncbi:MAG: sulfatase-like hydrolase/transferase [Prevotellaceae bacterium]|jgi:phosphoglycerol transferase MdoB-like AlkP superfamily enzyme|nr:sulfatase-like hydrolase/transferase [Prevotellaceae bacterium]